MENGKIIMTHRCFYHDITPGEVQIDHVTRQLGGQYFFGLFD